MIEPPGQAVIRAIFEIDDRVLFAVELAAIKGVTGTVHRRRVPDFGVTIDRCAVKFGKNGRGRNAVKAIAVIKYP